MKLLHNRKAHRIYTILMIPSWLFVPLLFVLIDLHVVHLPRGLAAVVVCWIPLTVVFCLAWGYIQDRPIDRARRAAMLTTRPFGSARSLSGSAASTARRG